MSAAPVADAPEPEPKQKTPRKGRKAKADPNADPLFARFWAAYPNRVDKPAALRAWAKLKVDEPLLAKILAGLELYKAAKQDWRAWKNPGPWLNARRWEDEVPAAAALPLGQRELLRTTLRTQIALGNTTRAEAEARFGGPLDDTAALRNQLVDRLREKCDLNVTITPDKPPEPAPPDPPPEPKPEPPGPFTRRPPPAPIDPATRERLQKRWVTKPEAG